MRVSVSPGATSSNGKSEVTATQPPDATLFWDIGDDHTVHWLTRPQASRLRPGGGGRERVASASDADDVETENRILGEDRRSKGRQAGCLTHGIEQPPDLRGFETARNDKRVLCWENGGK